MTDDTTPDELERIEKGLDALFATDVAREILEAVDFEAILSEGPAENPVDVERLGDAIGRPVGRMLVRQLVGGSGTAGFAKRTVAGEVGGRAAAWTVRLILEHVEVNGVRDDIAEMVPGVVVDPPADDVTIIDIEDGTSEDDR